MAGNPVSSTCSWLHVGSAQCDDTEKLFFLICRRQLTRQSKWRGILVHPPHLNVPYSTSLERRPSVVFPHWIFYCAEPQASHFVCVSQASRMDDISLTIPQMLAAFWAACLLLMGLFWFLTKCKYVVLLSASSQKMKNNAFDTVSRILT